MKSGSPAVARFRSSWPVVVLILAGATVFIGVVLFIHFWKGAPFGNLTRDPAAIAEKPIYTGFLSQVGIFFWSATAAVCIFGGQLVSKLRGDPRLRSFLAVSGIFTLVLGLDDVFLLHEEFFPYFGIPEKLVYFSYALFLLWHLVRFRSIIRQTEFVLLGMALLFFGLSLILDVVQPRGLDPFLFEDGAKLVGIMSWLAYFFRSAAAAIVL